MRYLFLFLLFFSLQCFSQEQAGNFLGGVKAYQNRDFPKAKELFSPLLAEYPENPKLLYNLGLVEYQLGNYGMALGLWRKARFLDQSFALPAQAIEFTEEKFFPEQKGSAFFITIL